MKQPAGQQGDLDRAMLADLVEAIGRDRDRAAFATRYSYVAPRVKGWLIRQGADPAAAEELAQESLLMVWTRAATFDRRQSSVSTWLFTIARNKRIDALRREKRPEFDPLDPALVPAPAAAQDAAYDAVQDEERLQRVIATLPAEQAELLHLAFYEDRSHRDIAVLRGLPLGTVKSRLRLALAGLRTALDGED